MLVYAQQFTLDDRIVYITACERCGSIVGELSSDEILALSTGEYGKVLCFECEEKSCPVCQKELHSKDNEARRKNGTCWFCWWESRGEKLNELLASVGERGSIRRE